MTRDDLDQLRNRLDAGERPTEELRALMAEIGKSFDPALTEEVSDVLNAALHRKVLPTLETAKAIVETAVIGDSTYPISTNDGLIYDNLSSGERLDLIDFVVTSNSNAPIARSSLVDFADDLAGRGPQV